MARFTLPRDIYYGSGAIDELKNLKGYKKAMILTGGSSWRDGNSSSAITIFSISILLLLWYFKTDGSTCTICAVYMKTVVRAVNCH